MPGHARKDIVRKGEIGIYHTWSRVVQRAYLCGLDPLTGHDYEYRRDRIVALLKYQASVFAVDIGNFAVLSNHQHAIIRLRPDIAKTWSDEEVAWRWKLAWPTWIDGQWVRQPTDEEIEKLLAKPERIPHLRENLSDLSWLMARWKEPISKMSNAESRTKGHFYEQRFGSREFFDEGAVLCGNVYLDLNQVKAGMARSLEESRHSAIYYRIQALQAREAAASLEKFRSEASDDYALEVSDLQQLLADCFLAPISLGGPLILTDVNGAAMAPIVIPSAECTSANDADDSSDDFDEQMQSVEDEETTCTVPDIHDSDRGIPSHGTVKRKGRKVTRKIHRRLQRRRRPRASDHAILDMPIEQYLQVVRISMEEIQHDMARSPPDELTSQLRRFGIEPSKWICVLEHFEKWFHHAVGRAELLEQKVSHVGRNWLQGIRACRDVFT